MMGFNLGGGQWLGGDGAESRTDEEVTNAVREAAEAEAEEARMTPTAPYHFGQGGDDASVGGAAFAMSHTAERPQDGLGDPGTGQLGPDPWNGQGGEVTGEGADLEKMADVGQENQQPQQEPGMVQAGASSASTGPVPEGSMKALLFENTRPVARPLLANERGVRTGSGLVTATAVENTSLVSFQVDVDIESFWSVAVALLYIAGKFVQMMCAICARICFLAATAPFITLIICVIVIALDV